MKFDGLLSTLASQAGRPDPGSRRRPPPLSGSRRAASAAVLLPALLLAAAIAGVLAERAVSPNRGEWWASMVVGGLAFGAWVRLADSIV